MYFLAIYMPYNFFTCAIILGGVKGWWVGEGMEKHQRGEADIPRYQDVAEGYQSFTGARNNGAKRYELLVQNISHVLSTVCQ